MFQIQEILDGHYIYVDDKFVLYKQITINCQLDLIWLQTGSRATPPNGLDFIAVLMH